MGGKPLGLVPDVPESDAMKIASERTNKAGKRVVTVETDRMTAHQGTESLIQLAADLRATAPHVLEVFDLRRASGLMQRAADAIERLAPLEPDIDAAPGEN